MSVKITSGLARERNFRIPFCALIDPGPQKAYLLCRQFRTLFRHYIVRVEAGNQFDHQTLFAVSRNERCAGVASYQHRFACVETKTSFVASASVALDATGFEERFDVRRKIHLARS